MPIFARILAIRALRLTDTRTVPIEPFGRGQAAVVRAAADAVYGIVGVRAVVSNLGGGECIRM